MIYGFGAIGDFPIGAAPVGGAVLGWLFEEEAPPVVNHRRKRNKVYTRERDNLNIYWQADDIDLKPEPVKPKPKLAKGAPPKLVPRPKPDEVVPLANIEALAREYDEIQAYRQAVKQKQWAQLARLYERLMDEADVEFLLAHV